MRIFQSLLLLFLCSSALAHRVNIFAYVEGKKIITRNYYSNGSPVKHGEIAVYNDQGNKLLSGKTDDAGIFSFPIPERTDLKIVLHASMGHQAETMIRRSDFPEIVTPHRPKTPKVATIGKEEMRKIVEELLDEKLHPLFELIAQQQKKEVSATEVVGGIGYIIGIMGIIMYFRSKKKSV